MVILILILCACSNGNETKHDFHVRCNELQADRKIPEAREIKSAFANENLLKVKSMHSNLTAPQYSDWDLETNQFKKSSGYEINFPLPCETCNAFVLDQSPNQTWQLVRTITTQEPTIVQDWFLSHDTSIELPMILNSMNTWTWSLDETLFWSEQLQSGPAWDGVLMDLENETTTKFFNNGNYPGIPTEKSSPGPVAGLVNVTFEPVQKGIWYTDWTRGISESVNYYDTGVWRK